MFGSNVKAMSSGELHMDGPLFVVELVQKCLLLMGLSHYFLKSILVL